MPQFSTLKKSIDAELKTLIGYPNEPEKPNFKKNFFGYGHTKV